jgi:putative transposase
MGRKKAHRPEEIVAKLRQVEVLAQGKAVAGAVRAIGVTEKTNYRWPAEFGGVKLDQVMRLKELERERPAGAAQPSSTMLHQNFPGPSDGGWPAARLFSSAELTSPCVRRGCNQ